MGMSGAAGLAVGAALKRVSRTIAAAAGVVIIAVQVLVWQDFIVVKWDNVESKLKPYLDVDGDGIITEKDAQHVLEGGMGVLSQVRCWPARCTMLTHVSLLSTPKRPNK
ncbi:unnamed protein product [Ostreobium quekettii]|uniref:EF-hand domain-containing protein n=1 Tax=Ostreobium quekettii TaxID=121088 RepID=A0A8S1IUQ9_9CHLO|nr:unnamed protein product [Ostreobium quekettii]